MLCYKKNVVIIIIITFYNVKPCRSCVCILDLFTLKIHHVCGVFSASTANANSMHCKPNVEHKKIKLFAGFVHHTRIVVYLNLILQNNEQCTTNLANFLEHNSASALCWVKCVIINWYQHEYSLLHGRHYRAYLFSFLFDDSVMNLWYFI